jgi:cytoskeletal protein RodZ
MSLEQVSAATNLRRTVLAAMEDDDFRHCGGDFYVKAHVREIARVLGVAPEPFLTLYAEQQPTVAGLDSSGVEPPRERIERGARRGPNWSAAMAVALVLVLGFGVYRVATRPSPATVDIAASPATPSRSAQATTTAPRPKPTPPARPTPSDAVAQVPRAGVDVRLSAAGGPSWVSVTNGGGKLLFRGLVPRGKTRTFTTRPASA